MMDESIYDLIPRQQQETFKQQKGKSKYTSKVQDEYSKAKADYKTMGPAKVQTRAPNEFLKKHEREPKIPEKQPFQYPDADHRRPPVPRHDDRPVMGMKTTKNFITKNAVDNIMAVPRKPEKNFVDTKKGDKQLLNSSGMEPKYIHKKEFGETPEYIIKRKEEMERAQEEYNQYVAEHFKRGAMQQLSESERQDILNGLKANWEYLLHQFQGLSVVTDTAPKKYRKERMEAEMKQLERDIEQIERHSTIYIAN